MALETGTQIGRYKIQSLLGAGGMGEVYLALDTDLDRPAAIKFLSSEFASDENRMKRFVREARTASALNHPNIITIYEISRNETENTSARFIVTEFIEGETLRQFIKRKSVNLADIIDIVIQIASALVAAHAAGIVHRDIKPENIMIRADGIVKVLDFGLAKPIEPRDAVDKEAATKMFLTTNPGAVMGTINYMSPEQASAAADVDARTDVWSLGVVLYEMITGRLPFEGKTPSHTIVQILENEPAPLSACVENVPETLEWIVADTLTKDRDERCQTALELLSKLRRLKQKMDAEIEIERSLAPSPLTPSDPESRNRLISHHSSFSTGQSTSRSNDFNNRQTNVSSAEYIVNQVKRNKFGAGLLFAFGLLAIAGIAFGIYKFASEKKASDSHQPLPLKITRLTNNGRSSNPSISPDGKYVAYVFRDAGKSSLVLQQVGGSASRELGSPSDGFFVGSTFSPDGNFVYYVKGEKASNTKSLYQIPVLGGDARKLIDDVDSTVTFSPDGKKMAFLRGYVKEQEMVLLIANSDGRGEERVTAQKSPSTILQLAWSPDGNTIAFAVNTKDDKGYFISINEVKLEDKTERAISSERWRNLTNLQWLPDGSGLMLAARDRASDPGSPMQIWKISYPVGEKQKITNDLNEYRTASPAANAPVMIAESGSLTAKLWVTPANNNAAKSARQISAGNVAGADGITWTPDGRIIYTNLERENIDLWTVNPDGSGRKQLTFDRAADISPTVSPDNRYIVFESNRGTGWGIWRMNADGSNPVELLSNIGRSYPKISADSKWVIYGNQSSGSFMLWKFPIEGSGGGRDQIQLTRELAYGHSLSPDGKLVAYLTRAAEANSPVLIKIIPIEGGEAIKTSPAPANVGFLRWSADSRSLNFAKTENGASNVWSLPLDGAVSEPKRLTDWQSDQIYSFDWSPDGKWLACSRGDSTNDLVLIENFR